MMNGPASGGTWEAEAGGSEFEFHRANSRQPGLLRETPRAGEDMTNGLCAEFRLKHEHMLVLPGSNSWMCVSVTKKACEEARKLPKHSEPFSHSVFRKRGGSRTRGTWIFQWRRAAVRDPHRLRKGWPERSADL